MSSWSWKLRRLITSDTKSVSFWAERTIIAETFVMRLRSYYFTFVASRPGPSFIIPLVTDIEDPPIFPFFNLKICGIELQADRPSREASKCLWGWYCWRRLSWTKSLKVRPCPKHSRYDDITINIPLLRDSCLEASRKRRSVVLSKSESSIKGKSCFTTQRWPPTAAQWSGVKPNISRVIAVDESTASKSSTTCSCPNFHAT